MLLLSWGKFSKVFRTLFLSALCVLFLCSSFTLALTPNSASPASNSLNSLNNAFSDIQSIKICSSDTTLPELNQSSDPVRTYDFDSGETVTLEEDMGTTSSGVFSINGASADEPNSIVFNGYSGFTVSKIQTTLNITNVTITDAVSTIGSVIYSTSSDADITITNVTFENNSTISQGDALGGAIYFKSGTLTLTNTSFTGNSAVTETEGCSAKGGAIYAQSSIEMIADSDNVVIADNYTQTADGTVSDNAIYIDNSDATLTLSAVNGGSFSISDNIDGESGYSVVMSGDGTGTIGIYNSITNANISISNVSISFVDGEASTYELDNLTIGSNVDFTIEVDLANGVSDCIYAQNGSGEVNISSLVVLSLSSDESVTLQILKEGSDLTLNIDTLLSKLETSTQATMYNDTVLADSIELAATDSENDSITVSGLKDVLYEMVHDTDSSHMLKNFIFRTETEYVLTQDLGEMPQESILNIYNISDADYGTINANGHSMFELTNSISVVNLKNIIIKNANTDKSGSVVYITNPTSSFSAENSVITGNSADGGGGAIYASSGSVTLTDTTVSENTSSGSGGAIYAAGNAQVELVNVDFISNSAEGEGGAIYTETDVTISADGGSSTFEGNTAGGESNAIYAGSSDAVITLDARNNGTINMNDSIDGVDGYEIDVTGNSSGNVNINSTITNAVIVLSGSNLNLAEDDLLSGCDFTASGGKLNLVNGEVGTTDFSTLTISGKTNVSVDVDLANLTMDRITAEIYLTVSGTINVSKMNLLSDSTSSTVKIYFADSAIRSHITSSVKSVAYSKIYRYIVTYDPSSGYFTFYRGDGKDASSYNPAILPIGIAQQTVYMNQLRNYQSAMYHSDTYMMLPKAIRNYAGKYAICNPDFRDLGTDATLERFLAIPEEIKSIWIRPYAEFETVPLKHGSDVTSTNYGTIFGGDSDLYELSHGFKFVYGGYVGYNGNITSYSNVESLHQGAVVGATAYLYRGNFFNTITANVGWGTNESDTAYGTDSMTHFTCGFSDKFGYNFEINSGKIIIQPSITMGYTFVNSSDYTTSNGVIIDSDPLHAMHFAPALKIVSNTESGWQPYICAMLMTSFSDKTNFTANTVKLPSMSVDPYFEYGIGIQRRWHDKYSGFAQATVRHGGRRGVAFLFGFRYMLGKILSREHSLVHVNTGKKKVVFKERKAPEIVVGSLRPAVQNKIPPRPHTEYEDKSKLKYSVINGLKKVSRIIFFKYNADVSAKVVTDTYTDGVIKTVLEGMKGVGTTEFKDKDLVSGRYSLENPTKDVPLPDEFDKTYNLPVKNIIQTKTSQKPAQTPKEAPDIMRSVMNKPVQQSIKPAADIIQNILIKPAQKFGSQNNTADLTTEVKNLLPPIKILPLRDKNRKNAVLNQRKYTPPVKTNSYKDYSMEIIRYKL